MNDIEIMAVAFEEAKAAYARGECPVGAVMVGNGEVVARAGNRETRDIKQDGTQIYATVKGRVIDHVEQLYEGHYPGGN
jgi:tRNA(Arg) A34 adenosine deaminase TadA